MAKDLNRIGKAIDGILNTKNAWTRREFDFYIMLTKKAEEFHQRAKAYHRNNQDKEHIIQNFLEQPWYQKSRHISIIKNMLRGMDILEHVSKVDPDGIELRLKLQFPAGFQFVIKYIRSESSVKYYVYFSDGERRGNICYLDTNKSTAQQKQLKLPEYDIINGIVSSRLDRYDIIHFASELLIYYDESGQIQNEKMGANVPISLVYLASITNG